MTPIDVVPISPVFVRATPMHTAASAIVVIIDVVFRKNRNWKKATHGVVIIFANLEHINIFERGPPIREDLLVKSDRVKCQT